VIDGKARWCHVDGRSIIMSHDHWKTVTGQTRNFYRVIYIFPNPLIFTFIDVCVEIFISVIAFILTCGENNMMLSNEVNISSGNFGNQKKNLNLNQQSNIGIAIFFFNVS
jgi:hypothetical protein